MSGSDTVQRKVAGVDTYVWTTPIPGSQLRQHHWADRGEIIDVSPEEAARGEAIIDKGVAALVAADAAVDEPSTFAPATDDVIATMTVPQIQAYLGQVPDGQQDEERDRVLAIEGNRATPRASVLALDPEYEPHPDDVVPDA